MAAGKLRDRVAFDEEVETPDGLGGRDRVWSERFQCWAEIRYERGAEAVQAGGQTGTAVWKIRIRSNTSSRAITTDYRMRDLRRDIVLNIREVDAISDRAYVWLIVEQGVAV